MRTRDLRVLAKASGGREVLEFDIRIELIDLEAYAERLDHRIKTWHRSKASTDAENLRRTRHKILILKKDLARVIGGL